MDEGKLEKQIFRPYKRAEKPSPNFRAMEDYITGSHRSATPSAIEENYKRMTQAERISYLKLLSERHRTLQAIVRAHSDDATADRVGTEAIIGDIARIIVAAETAPGAEPSAARSLASMEARPYEQVLRDAKAVEELYHDKLPKEERAGYAAGLRQRMELLRMGLEIEEGKEAKKNTEILSDIKNRLSNINFMIEHLGLHPGGLEEPTPPGIS